MKGTRSDLEAMTRAVEAALADFKGVKAAVEIFGYQRPNCTPKVGVRGTLFFLDAFKVGTGIFDTPEELAQEVKRIAEDSVVRMNKARESDNP